MANRVYQVWKGSNAMHIDGANYRPLQSARGPWKQIMEYAASIQTNTKFVLGNGRSTTFWRDHWVGSGPIYRNYPSLFTLSTKKNALVDQMWDGMNGSWNLALRRNLKDSEILEFGNLMVELENMALTNGEDKLAWLPDPNGTFSVKSYSNLQHQNSSTNETIFKFIWKENTPKKIKFFLWELAHRAINTNDRLQKRLPHLLISPQWCLLCRKDLESQEHIFNTCAFTRQFWDLILPIFSWSCALPKDPPALLSMTLEGHPFKARTKLIWEYFIRILFWHTWQERNRRTFQDRTLTFTVFFDNIVYTVVSWLKRSSLFSDYSFSTLLSNWSGLL